MPNTTETFARRTDSVVENGESFSNAAGAHHGAVHSSRNGLGSWIGRRRLITGLIPAGLMTVGLFAGMSHLISVDEITLEEKPSRILTKITASEQPVVNPRETQDIQHIKVSAPPPPPKISRPRANDINLPVPNLKGRTPDEGVIKKIALPEPTIIVMDDSMARPLAPPVVRYPTSAASIGLEGNCEVRFDVSVMGTPEQVEATCTDRAFVKEAERAVKRVQFAPKIVRGQRAERRNVLYPLEFRLRSN